MTIEGATLERAERPATADDVLTQVDRLVPSLRDHARDTELARRVPDSTLLALQGTGAFRLTLPQDRGGYEASPALIAEVLAQISRGDPSAGWVTAIVTAMNYIPALLPDEGAEDIFATPELRISGLLAPTGRAQPTSDGCVFQASGCGTLAASTATGSASPLWRRPRTARSRSSASFPPIRSGSRTTGRPQVCRGPRPTSSRSRTSPCLAPTSWRSPTWQSVVTVPASTPPAATTPCPWCSSSASSPRPPSSAWPAGRWTSTSARSAAPGSPTRRTPGRWTRL